MIDDVMYGMMPSANTAKRRKLPPVNVFTKPRKVLSAIFMNSSKACGSTPGENDAADAVHREQTERKEQPLAQVGDRKDVAEALEHLSHLLTVRPPPRSWREPTLNLWATTLMAFFSSPSPSTLIGFRPPDALFAQQLGRDFRSQAAELVQIDHNVFDAENIRESALRHRRTSGIWPPSKPGTMRLPEREP